MKKVLVADDDDYLRMFIREALEKKGLEVVEAADGDTAIEMISSHLDIDLLILDLEMPNMSGKEAFRIIHSLRPALKCLISSADITGEDAEVLSGMGVKAFLEKPYLPEDLYRTIGGLFASTSGTGPCELKTFKEVRPSERLSRRAKREPVEKTIDFSVNFLEFKGLRRLDLKAVTTDMSTMGLGIKTDYPLEPRNVLHFANELGIHAEGVVRWVMEYGDSFKAGVEGLNNWPEFLLGQ